MATIWRGNMLGYLSADITCSEKQIVFRERSAVLKIGEYQSDIPQFYLAN